MADTITDLSADAIQAIKDKVNSLNETVDGFTQHVDTAITHFKDLAGVVGSITDSAQKFSGILKKGFDGFVDGAKEAKEGVEKLTSLVGEGGAAFTKFWNEINNPRAAKEATDGIRDYAQIIGTSAVVRGLTGIVGAAVPATASMLLLGESAKDSTGSIAKSAANIKLLTGAIPGLGEVLGGLTEGFFQNWEAVRDAENGLRRMLAASGDFNSVFGKSTDITDNLGTSLQQYYTYLYDVGNRTGETTDQVAKYQNELGKITSAYTTMVDLEPNKPVQLLDAAIRTAKGTGHGFNEVFKVMNDQFRRFGQVGKEPLGLFAQMHYAAQNLGIRLEFLTQNVDTISNSFRAYGDMTQGALKLTEHFYDAFKGVEGLGPETIQNIIKGVSGSIEQLNVAQKAFLSAQTGGAGGLRGAYEIEMKLKEGNIQEVYGLMEQALKQQFGGRITTLEEGAQSDTAAAELTREVAFLRQGPFGAMVKNDAEAYRLLESFKAGETPEGISPKEAFQSAMTESESIQQRHTTILTGIENQVTTTANYAKQISIELGRPFVGVGASSLFGSFDERLRSKPASPMGVVEQPLDVDTAMQNMSIQLVDSIKDIKHAAVAGSANILPELANTFGIDLEKIRAKFEAYSDKMKDKEGFEKVLAFAGDFLKDTLGTREISKQEEIRKAPQALPQTKPQATEVQGAETTVRGQNQVLHQRIHVTFKLDPNKSDSGETTFENSTEFPNPSAPASAISPSEVSVKTSDTGY